MLRVRHPQLNGVRHLVAPVGVLTLPPDRTIPPCRPLMHTRPMAELAASIPRGTSPLPGGALRRLLTARLLLVAGEGMAVVLTAALAPIRLPLVPMFALLALHGVLVSIFRLGARDRSAGHDTGHGEVFLHLLADAAIIAALVYFSGGYANPFISLMLLPLVLGAALLPAAYAWAITLAVAGLYTLLMAWYRPLEVDMTDSEAGNLHLLGMWLSFLFTAALVAAFVARLTADLRERDRALAEARETALRDEQIFALGMQAAAAAHDLATPLSTLCLALEEMRSEYANDEDLAPALAAMTSQAVRMKAVLDRLREFAGATRASPTARPVDQWVADLVDHWQLMRPQARVVLHRFGPAPAPCVRDEPLLASSLTTLLNNAADVSPQAIEVEADWSGGRLEIRVLDRGPGPEAGVSKAGGWGVGLQLAQAALERLDGSLDLAPRPGGGTRASIRLALSSLGVVR